MHIAQLSPPSAPVSPLADGYVHRSIALLTDGLVDVGDDVTLLATEGSSTRARLVPTRCRGRSDAEALLAHLVTETATIGAADVIHDHTDLRILLRVLDGHPRIVHTLRNGSSEDLPDDADRVHLAATSWAQARRHPDITFAAVIPDGIRISDHPLVRHRADRIAYVGPATPHDGPLMAVVAAELLGLELVLALTMDDQAQRSYWREVLAPRARDATARVRLMAVPSDLTERQAVMGRVRGLIVPPALDDDLVHTVLEASALGTPVVAFEGDGAEEFVEDDVTGFVLPSVDVGGIAESIDRIGTIDPTACRAHVADRFSHQRMVRRYHELYEHLLTGPMYGLLPDHSVDDPPGDPDRADDLSAKERGGWVGTYLAMVAHDVRSPLAAIRGFAETLLEHRADMEQDESDDLLRRIIALSERLDLGARDVLDLDQLERGGFTLVREDVALPALCEHVLETVHGPGHRIEVHFEEPSVYADRTCLERVLSNLITNAVRHTPDGTSICVSSRREGGTVVVAVEDDGPGLGSEGAADAMAEPAHLTETRVGTGRSGLGLTLVRRLVELHGGELTAEDRAGGGASFRVTFPVRDTAVTPDRERAAMT